MEIKEMIEKRNDIKAKMTDIVDLAKKENRAVTAEEKQGFDAMAKEIAGIDRDIMQADIDSIKDIVRKPFAPTGNEQELKDVKAFANYVRGIVDTDAPMTKTDNGALVPTSIANKIIDTIVDICPVFAMSDRYNVKGKLSIPYYDAATSTLGMAYADEGTAAESGSIATKSIDLTGFLGRSLVKVSKSLVNNSDFDIVNFVISKVSLDAAEFIEGECLNGTTDKIAGLNAGITQVITAASATALTSDELIDLQDSVIDAYQAGSIWIMNRATRTAIRKLKDTEGQYLLNKDFTAQWGYTLLGKPVYTSDKMAKMAAGKTAVIYGDLSGLATKVSEDVNIQVLLEKYAEQHQTGILAFVEFDAKVENTQKLSKLVMKAV